MLMISERLISLKPSPTLEITAKAKAMKKAGLDVIGFGAGEPDFRTPDHIVKALFKAVDDGFIYYTPAPGFPELREAIAAKLKTENKIDAGSDQVIVTPGAKQALFEAVMALVNPGDEVLIPEPYWVSYVPMVGIAGGIPVPIPTRAEEDFRVQAEDIREALTPRSKLLILNSPNNPTGAVLSKKDLASISEVAIEEDIMVISDEIYEHIIYDRAHHSIAVLPDMADRTITVNGFSKAYSMTGWRLGYAAGPLEVIKAMSNLQAHSVSNTTSFVQKAGVAALKGGHEFIDRMVREFQKRRDRIVQLLNEMDGVTCNTPDGAFYVFPDFSSIDRDSLRLSKRLLEEVHVALIPGVAFGSGAEGFQRLSYATSMEKIEEGVDRIKRWVDGKKD